MKKFMCTILSTVLCVSLLTGCTHQRTIVSYTVYPIQWIYSRLTGNIDNVQSVQKDESVCVQRSQIRDDYEEVLANSEVFFHIGLLEPYLSVHEADIRESGAYDADLSSGNAVYSFKRYTPVVKDGSYVFFESPYYDSPAFDLVDTNKYDLNLYNDPITMLSMAKVVRDWLIKRYPENTGIYNENYKTLEEDLISLDAQYQQFGNSLQTSGKKVAFVSLTASFGNWQKTYGIEVYPLVLSKYGVLPNEEQLAVMIDKIQNDNVRYIANDTGLPKDMEKLYKKIKSDLNLKEIELSDLSKISEKQRSSGSDYLSIMYENLANLQKIVEEDSE